MKTLNEYLEVSERFLNADNLVSELFTDNPDIELIRDFSEATKLFGDSLRATTSDMLFPYLSAAYMLGYRKGRAATPLTLVVIPEENSQ